MATKHSIEVTDANFEELVLKSDKPVLVDFWAQWCGPCIMIGPMIEEIAQEQAGSIVVAKVDVDSNPEVSSRYSIRSIPTLILFNNGEIVDKQIGAPSKPELVRRLSAHSELSRT